MTRSKSNHRKGRSNCALLSLFFVLSVALIALFKRELSLIQRVTIKSSEPLSRSDLSNPHSHSDHPNEPSVINEHNLTASLWNDERVRNPRNSEYCPLPGGFPESALSPPRLRSACASLGVFSGILDKCMVRNNHECGKCLPLLSTIDGITEVPKWLNQMVRTVLQNEQNKRDERIEQLKSLTQRMRHQNRVVLMVVNHGYLYLFFNWLCSVHSIHAAHNATNGSIQSTIERMRNHLIIIAGDEKVFSLLKSEPFGFSIVKGYEFIQGDTVRIQSEATTKFGGGSHRFLVSLQIIYARDILSLGMDCILHDIDVVWFKDVLEYPLFPRFSEDSPNGELDLADLFLTYDGRHDSTGPMNSGFIYLSSKCRTLVFMDTLVKYLGLLVIGRSDQQLWNVFLKEPDFLMLRHYMLRDDHFVGGWQWGIKRGPRLPPLQQVWLAHAAWTAAALDKPRKFQSIRGWFFSDEQCPDLFGDFGEQTIPESVRNVSSKYSLLFEDLSHPRFIPLSRMNWARKKKSEGKWW